MASYLSMCVAECTDRTRIGVGCDTKNGEPRICISLDGEWLKENFESLKIQESNVEPYWIQEDWRALSPECAKSLYLVLKNIRNLFMTEDEIMEDNKQG